MDYEGIEANYIAGTPYLGADVKMYPGPGGYQGELVAWDVAHNRKAWGVKETKFPVYSGVLATGGDVVFYGTMDGWFKALDARTGTELWKFQVASGIVGNPMTYLGPDGKQYVAIYSGIGGWMGAVAFPDLSADDPYAALGVVGAMKDIKKYTAPGRHGVCLRSVGAVASASHGSCLRRRRRPRSRRASAAGRRCASAPIRTTCRSRTSAARASRTRSRRWWRASWPAARLLLAAAAPRLHPQHPERRTLRRGHRRAGALRPAADDAAVLSLDLRLRLAARSPPAVQSFDDPRLKTLTIGIQITGDDYDNPPAAQALAARHLMQNVRGYTVYGDYSKPDPQRDVVDAVADGRVDLAVVWGPLAGYFARREPAPLDVDAGQRRSATAVAAVRVRHRDGRAARRPRAARRGRRA